MILQLLILHKATAKIRSFFGNSIKKEEILGYHFNNNSREDIYLIFPKTKEELEEDISYFAYILQKDAYLSSDVDVLKQDINIHLF